MLLDPIADLSVAHSIGGKFIRGYFPGGYVGDMRIIGTNAAKTAQHRNLICGDDIKILSNLTCAFGVPLAHRDLTSLDYGAVVHAKADGLIVSVMVASFDIDIDKIYIVRSVISSNIPVLAGTGLNHNNLHIILPKVDGAIVASSLKVNGETFNEVDLERVKKFMSVANEIRK